MNGVKCVEITGVVSCVVSVVQNRTAWDSATSDRRASEENTLRLHSTGHRGRGSGDGGGTRGLTVP